MPSMTFDTIGRAKMVVLPYAPAIDTFSTTLSINNTVVQVIKGAPGAGLANFVTDLDVTNSSGTAVLISFYSRNTTGPRHHIASIKGGTGAAGHTFDMTVPIQCTTNATFICRLGTQLSSIQIACRGFIAPT